MMKRFYIVPTAKQPKKFLDKSKTDSFGRKESVTSSGYELNNTYKNGSASHSTTKLVDTMTYSYGTDDIASYSYTYDANGNTK